MQYLETFVIEIFHSLRCLTFVSIYGRAKLLQISAFPVFYHLRFGAAADQSFVAGAFSPARRFPQFASALDRPTRQAAITSGG